MAWTDWRRWIATLCVALVAFVMVEQAFASDPCHGAPATVSYNIADAVALTDGDADRSEDQNSLPAQQHHCCSAHVTGMPPAPHAGVLAPPVVTVEPPFVNARAPNGEQGGQDRPPRVSALV
ncbi:MAG: hypothetical protein IPG56_19010 [Caulobacteraceae bacterium]|nr:hypothetical protein [Caulobacteraceae bacterium]